MVTAVSIDYDFPEYTKIPPRTGVEGGNVEAIEGTIVTVHARTNEPARLAQSEPHHRRPREHGRLRGGLRGADRQVQG